MTTQDFLYRSYKKLSKFKFLILGAGLVSAIVVFIIMLGRPTKYTSFASVFPLNSTNDNTLSSAGLSSLLGINIPSQSFSQEATINIVELAQSRSTREAVALKQLPEFDNKKIGQLIIEEYNKNKWFWNKTVKVPANETELAAVAGDLMEPDIDAKINKNGILELRFTSSNKKLVRPVSYALINVISDFYKSLKIQKASVDYEFTVKKVDSLQNVANSYDRKSVQLSNTTMFVDPNKLQYQLPKSNVVMEKDRVLRQRDAAISNREDALWRLQKVTPIVQTLDKPEPPYDFHTPYKITFSLLAFIFFSGLMAFILTAGLFLKYFRSMLKEAIFGNPQS